MNVQGAGVERLLGRSIMPRFHALFSLGTVAGALVGTAMVALDVSVTAHLLVVGVATAAARAVRRTWLHRRPGEAEEGAAPASARARRSTPGASPARC